MKCVQVVGQGIPARFSDDDARRLVEVDLDGQYCPKSVWKHYHANEPVRPVHAILPNGRIVRL